VDHRRSLGSTALVSAGILCAHAPPAGADIEVTLSGHTEFGLKAATNETLQDEADRGYTFYMDNQVELTAESTTDTGVTYGSDLVLEIGSGDAGAGQSAADDAGDVFVDEVSLFFSGGFGRIELGRKDGAEDEMFLGAEDAQSGTGGLDGDTANLGSIINIQNTDDASKATYYTPRVGGFQLGASYVPDTSDDGGRDGPGFDEGFENSLGGGVNWVGAFADIGLTLSAVAIYGKSEDPGAPIGNDDIRDYSVGGLVGAGGLSLGATWGQQTDFNEGRWASLGLKYAFDDASVSVGCSWVDDDNLDDRQNIFVVSGDLGLAPGLAMLADVSYNTQDPGNDDGGGGQDGTLAGVVSIQLDY
jgi:outer membrane protein OmpU